MRVTVKNNSTNEVLWERCYPRHFQTNGEVIERGIQIDFPFYRGSLKEILFDGVLIVCHKGRATEDVVLSGTKDTDSLGLTFHLQGEISNRIQGLDTEVLFQGNEHNLFYTPPATHVFYLRKNEVYHIVKIRLQLTYFQRLLKKHHSVLAQLHSAIFNKHPIWLSSPNLMIPPRVRAQVEKIVYCNKKGFLKKLFLESMVIELLALQLEQFENCLHREQRKLTESDAQKIYAARDIMLRRMTHPPGLQELSRMIGLNEFKLKKGFKAIFGNTVYGYLLDVKLELAREWLLEKDFSVKEISQKVGYRHSAHFSVAFKKKFGYSPGNFRK